MKELENGTYDSTKVFDSWTSFFEGRRSRNRGDRINVGGRKTTGGIDGLALRESRRTHSRRVEENSGDSENEKINASSGKNNSKFSKKRRTDEQYDYQTLISKPDMSITEIDDSKTYKADSVTRKQIIKDALENAKKVGRVNERGEVFVYVEDIKTDVMISANSLRHGLDRRLKQNSSATLQSGGILKNSIIINELTPKNANAESSYVLLGVAKDQKGQNLHIVEFVINKFDDTMVSMDILYSLNSKKEESAVLNAPSPTENR